VNCFYQDAVITSMLKFGVTKWMEVHDLMGCWLTSRVTRGAVWFWKACYYHMLKNFQRL